MINPADLQIWKLIPQREPMIMIDSLVMCTDTICETSFEILVTNIFVKDGLFREPGLIENIAQTAAAKIGYKSLVENVPTPIGFIGSVNNLRVYSLPAVHSILTTSVEVTYAIMDASIIKATIHSTGELIAKCEMKIFIQKS